MQHRIVFKNADGTVGVIIPAISWAGNLEALAQKDVPTGLAWRIVNVDDLPGDRTFRNAWTDDNPTTTVDVDMVKARQIHMDYLRHIRNKKLEALDVEQLKGVDVASEKQALRDMPQNVDLTPYQTPESLKAVMPAILQEVNP